MNFQKENSQPKYNISDIDTKTDKQIASSCPAMCSSCDKIKYIKPNHDFIFDLRVYAMNNFNKTIPLVHLFLVT